MLNTMSKIESWLWHTFIKYFKYVCVLILEIFLFYGLFTFLVWSIIWWELSLSVTEVWGEIEEKGKLLKVIEMAIRD